MKIKAIDIISQKPLANVRIQLQVLGKDSGFMTATTDDKGILTLDDRYEGQRISTLQGVSIKAEEGAMLKVVDKLTSSGRTREKDRERYLDDSNKPIGDKKKETYK